MTRTGGVRVVRLIWGACLLAAPRTILRSCEPSSPRGLTLGAARLLGAREAVQGLLFEGKRYKRAGAAVEGLHGASMLWVATRFPAERRCALGAAAVSGLLLTAELAT